MYKYEHGGDIYSEDNKKSAKNFIDFSANINPLGIPKGVKKAYQQAIGDCTHYPDPFCRELREKLSKFLSVRSDYIFFGNGAADVLFRLATALKPKSALILAPTFADYEKALKTVDCKIEYYNLSLKNQFKVEENILSCITSAIDLVIICNPNNPTGQLTDKELMIKILRKCSEVGAKLLIDECFMDLVNPTKAYSMRSFLEEHPELIILKAFTKTFAIPGIRLGYCLNSDGELHKKLYESGQDWSVSVPAQRAGVAALDEEEYLHKTMQLLNTERNYLITNLEEIDAKVYGSKANYIFFRLQECTDLRERLLKRGFLIRSCDNYVNLGSDYYRIAVRKRYHNLELIRAIRDVLKDEIFNVDN